MRVLLTIGAVIATGVLIRIWSGLMEGKHVENESIASVEKRHPYLPRPGAIAVSLCIAGMLFYLSLRYGKSTSLASLTGTSATVRTIIVFLAISSFGMLDQRRWHGKKDRYRYLFGFVLGTLVTWILIMFKRAFFETGLGGDPFLMALGVSSVVIGWKFLFGPWSASVKATVLGTFIFWSTYAMLRHETNIELTATAIATVLAIIPVVIWCTLFLSYHRERMSVVLLAFFAGMLSTAPILFYGELMRRGTELNFFFFKIVPLNYGSTSEQFVRNSIFSGTTGTTTIVLVTLMTYLAVGVIEEVSKFWVLRHSSKEFFTSIDDTLQLAIMVALGFAFAENLVNPTYFVGFVRQYLLESPVPQWGPLLGSVFGRGILTIMVHVLSTGVLGYFFGLAFFATPLLQEQWKSGKGHPIIMSIHRMLGIKTETIYAQTQITLGLLSAIVIHGIFNFIVTLPEVLPGRPATVGALLNMDPNSFLSSIGITVIPALLYVVGGFWLITYLFERKEDMKEFGAVVSSQTFVS